MTTVNRRTIGYYDDSQGHGGTTRYLMELLGALDRERYQPVFFAPWERDWHGHLRALDVPVITLSPETKRSDDAERGERENRTSRPGPRPTPTAGRVLPEERVDAPQHSAPRSFRTPPSLAWSAGLVLELRRLAALFRRRPVDLLHSNNCGAEAAPIAARIAGIPRVLGTWHVDSTYDLTGSRDTLRYHLLERASMLALHRAIAVSDATRRDWLSRCRLSSSYDQRVTVIHNGIDPDRVRRQRAREEAKALFGVPADALVIGSLGRLDLAKGYEYLVRALPEVLRAEPLSLVAIAGSGPLQSQLQDLARTLGVGSAVRLLGFVADVRSALECMDIYVQPSLCEAHPLSLLEAGAIGLPLVVSAVGGMPESIVEGRTGFIVPPRDPEALVRALVPLVVDRSLRETMGQEAQAKSLSEFTRDRMVVRTMAIYDAMLGAETCREGAEESGRVSPHLLEQTP